MLLRLALRVATLGCAGGAAAGAAPRWVGSVALDADAAQGGFGSVVQVGAAGEHAGQPARAVVAVPAAPLWTLHLLVGGSAVDVRSDWADATEGRAWVGEELLWRGVRVPGAPTGQLLDVRVAARVASSSRGPPAADLWLSAHVRSRVFGARVNDGPEVLVAAYSLSAAMRHAEGAPYSVLQPRQWGVVHECVAAERNASAPAPPATGWPWCAEWDLLFPQQSQSMQWMASAGGDGACGLFVAALDPGHAVKRMAHARSVFSVRQPLLPPAPNASAKYPLRLQRLDGDWWDAAQLYRDDFALAALAAQGRQPLALRRDLPGWALDITFWVNSHWQELDLFNKSGGDPAVVEAGVGRLLARLNGTTKGGLGLHWYEWDLLGYAADAPYAECRAKHCGFDTSYPQYEPPRGGFSRAVERLRARGVTVAPYINGRLFDVDSQLFDAAAQAAAVRPAVRESYGSGAAFTVMCPATRYWQSILAQVVGQLATTGVVAVYMDQIAAAEALLCEAHDHSADFWSAGYAAVLALARRAASRRAEEPAPFLLLTEGVSEAWLGQVDAYLELPSTLLPASGPLRVVPAFQAALGGFALALGGLFYQRDLDAGGDVFAAKLARQLVLQGQQLGWFALVGGSDDMGLLERLLAPEAAPEVAYLAHLEHARWALREVFAHGRAARALPLRLSPSDLHEQHVARGAWLLGQRELVVLWTWSQAQAQAQGGRALHDARADLQLDLADMGLLGAERYRVDRLSLPGGEWQPLRESGPTLLFGEPLRPRRVVALRVRPLRERERTKLRADQTALT
jgi:hypothetical protein